MRPSAWFVQVAITALFAVFSAFAAFPGNQRDLPALFDEDTDALALARKIAREMSAEELVGQCLMMTWPGETMPAELLDWIRIRHIGGIKVFGWNGKDTVKLATAVAAAQKVALGSGRGIPLLVATDQEGGMVRHIKGATSQTPGNMALGATDSPEDARLTGFYIGRELAAMGINMNFAPVVDLATQPASLIIGPRAFSDDPGMVARLGAAYAHGLAQAGIIATAKHFPGHGDTLTDSHGRLPIIPIDGKTMRSRELVPFAALIKEGIPAVMAGHLSFPAIDASGVPSSLSRYFMTGVLRTELGFKGIAITDDLYMHGASVDTGGNPAVFSGGRPSMVSGEWKTARIALDAGNDVLMFSRLVDWNDNLWKNLVEDCVSDSRFRSRLEEATVRILDVKLRYLGMPGKVRTENSMAVRDFRIPDPSVVSGRVPDPEGTAFFRDHALRAATLLSGGEILPLQPRGKILVASPFRDFIELAAAYYPGAATFLFSYRPMNTARSGELDAFRNALKEKNAVILCVANEAGADFARAALRAGKKVAVVSVDSPVWTKGIPRNAAVIAVYSDTVPSLLAGLDVVSGRSQAKGKLPLAYSEIAAGKP